MRAQTTTCRYRGDKIVIRYFGGRNMAVSVEDWRGIVYYRTSCGNLQSALAYATNAVHYHRDGEATWPSGPPLTVPTTLPQTKARRAKRVEHRLAARAALRRQLLRSPQVQDYLDEKREDW